MTSHILNKRPLSRLLLHQHFMTVKKFSKKIMSGILRESYSNTHIINVQMKMPNVI